MDEIMLIEGLEVSRAVELPHWPEKLEPTITNISKFVEEVHREASKYRLTKDILLKNIGNLVTELRESILKFRRLVATGSDKEAIKVQGKGVKQFIALKFLKEAYNVIDKCYGCALENFVYAHSILEIPVLVVFKEEGDRLSVQISDKYIKDYPWVIRDFEGVSFDTDKVPGIVGSFMQGLGVTLTAAGKDKAGQAVSAWSSFSCELTSAFFSKKEKTDCQKYATNVAFQGGYKDATYEQLMQQSRSYDGNYEAFFKDLLGNQLYNNVMAGRGGMVQEVSIGKYFIYGGLVLLGLVALMMVMASGRR